MPSKNLYLSDDEFAAVAYLALELKKPISDLLKEAVAEGLRVLHERFKAEKLEQLPKKVKTE